MSPDDAPMFQPGIAVAAYVCNDDMNPRKSLDV